MTLNKQHQNSWHWYVSLLNNPLLFKCQKWKRSAFLCQNQQSFQNLALRHSKRNKEEGRKGMEAGNTENESAPL